MIDRELNTYIFFSFFVPSFQLKHDDNFEVFYILELSMTSILLGYELTSIQYMLIETRKAFIETVSKAKASVESIDNAYNIIEIRLTKSYWYYAFTFFVILPLLIIDIYELRSGQMSTFYDWERTTISLLLDAYNYLIAYLNNILLAIILWVMSNILFLIYEMGCGKYLAGLNFKPLCGDQISGLGPIRNLILKISTIYFICVTLIILAYMGPSNLIPLPSIYYIILLIVGTFFFKNPFD